MIIDESNLEKELIKILDDILDIEEVEYNKLLIIKKNGKVILNNTPDRIKEICYERLGESIFGKKNKNLRRVVWSDEDIRYLIENSNEGMSELSKRIGKSKYQINSMMSELNLFSKKAWTEEDIIFLKKHIEAPLIWVSEQLNRSLASVKSKRRVLKEKGIGCK